MKCKAMGTTVHMLEKKHTKEVTQPQFLLSEIQGGKLLE